MVNIAGHQQVSKMKHCIYHEKEMQMALEAVKKGMAIATAARQFKVPRMTLSDKIKGKTPEIRKLGAPTVLTVKEESILVEWIKRMAKAGFPITKSQILYSVTEIMKRLNRPNPFTDGVPGRYWYEAFCRRHPEISHRVPQNLTRSRASVTRTQIKAWFDEVFSYLSQEGFEHILHDPMRVFNADESAFFLNPKGSRILAPRGEKNIYSLINTDEKENLTVLINCNAAGLVAPPLVIFKNIRLNSELVSSVPSHWAMGRSPDTGWMTSEIFYEYVANAFNLWLTKNNIKRPILFFVDGHVSHLSMHLSQLCEQSGIILVSLLPNATHLLQPMDVAVFKTLKDGWKESRTSWVIKHILEEGGRLKKNHFCTILDVVIKERLTPEVLRNGFRKCGLVPWDPSAVDYGKIPTTSDVQPTQPQLEWTKEFERAIGSEKISQFRDGNFSLEDTSLYHLWRKVTQAQESSTELISSSYGPNTNGAAHSNEQISQESTAESISSSYGHNTNGAAYSNEQISQESAAESISSFHVDEAPYLDSNKFLSIKSNAPAGTPSPFKSGLFWPGETRVRGKKRRTEKLPAVATSKQWQRYMTQKHEKKAAQLKEKAEKKKEREEKKRTREESKKKKNEERELKKSKESKKKTKKMVESDSSDSSVEIPADSGDSCGEDWGDPLSGEEDDSYPNSTTRVEDFVIVKYGNDYYPGQVVALKSEGVLIKTMEKKGLMSYKWPEKEDLLVYHRDDVIKKIKKPTMSNSRGFFVIPEMNQFSIFRM